MMDTLRKLTVKDAYRLDNEVPITLGFEDEISEVIDNFAQHGDLRGVFIVDEEHRFSGVITRVDLLDWARVKLGAALLIPVTDMDKTLRLSTLVNATKAGDILRKETDNVSVCANDTLAHALQIMLDTELIVLPVVNESRKIIGNLTLSELLFQVLSKS
jgi:CBS domain-containing protein